MDERDDWSSIRDLADLAGMSVRTIHYYIAEGLLPPPQGAKRNASYTGAHLARLRLIAALREEGLALAAIRARLAPLADEQALAVVTTLDEHLEAGDRAITILGLIEAALTRATTSTSYELQDVSIDRAMIEEEPVQPTSISELPTRVQPESPVRASALYARRPLHGPNDAAPAASA